MGSSLFTSACPSTSMATRSLRDSVEKGFKKKKKMMKGVVRGSIKGTKEKKTLQYTSFHFIFVFSGLKKNQSLLLKVTGMIDFQEIEIKSQEAVDE